MEFSNHRRLASRFSYLLESKQKVTFLLGSAISNSGAPDYRGVPTVSEIIARVRCLYTNPEDIAEFDSTINSGNSTDRYQSAMRYVIETRGIETLNRLVRDSVIAASLGDHKDQNDEELEMIADAWHLTPALEAIGQIVSTYPNSFNAPILTTNFDPLIEVSIRRRGGNATSVVLPSDGNFHNVTAGSRSAHIVHLHGFWRQGDMLHTPNQLNRERPQLNGALRMLLRQSVLVVLGYGGWSDVFTKTLIKVISEHADPLDVLWCFYENDPGQIMSNHEAFLTACAPLIGQRLVLYAGVDCHEFLPLLANQLGQGASYQCETITPSCEKPSCLLPSSVPPSFGQTWVGRAAEIDLISKVNHGVVAIFGFGGVGKTALAARILSSRLEDARFARWAWVDCREQENTIITHMIKLIAAFSAGEVFPAQRPDDEIVRTLLDYLSNIPSVIVFDNVDSYVDLETEKTVGPLRMLIDACAEQNVPSLIILTCRPKISHSSTYEKGLHLKGLNADETIQLFTMRLGLAGKQDPSAIRDMHLATAGNPLLLNLTISQILSKRLTMDELARKIKAGTSSDLEFSILDEIWDGLNDKQQLILRYLSESSGPQWLDRILGYVEDDMTHNRANRCLTALVSMDVVSDRIIDGRRMLELHPLVRSHIRSKFTREQRKPFLSKILLICNTMIGRFRQSLKFSIDDVYVYWLDKVEICVQTEDSEGAVYALLEVSDPLIDSSHSEEFVRICAIVANKFGFDVSESVKNNWDKVFKDFVRQLAYMGRVDEVNRRIGDFKESLQGKTARYVMFCEMASHALWILGDTAQALRIAEEGVELKESTNVDTDNDSSHEFALALRDEGRIDEALEIFQMGHKLEDILAGRVSMDLPQFYGNIGRSLQLKGSLEDALDLLCRSAKMLLVEKGYISETNRGWAAYWISDILFKQGDFLMAFCASAASAEFWARSYPRKEKEARSFAAKCRELIPDGEVMPQTNREVVAMYEAWISNGIQRRISKESGYSSAST